MNNEEKTVDNAVDSRPYTLRPLKDKDLYPVLDIISKVFPDEQLASAFGQIEAQDKTVEEIGIQVALKLGVAVIHNISKVHDEVYALLADVSGIKAEEIEEMEFGTTPMMIWDIVSNARNAGFFKVFSKLF